MLTDRARVLTRGLVEPVALGLGRLGLTPNALTIVGCLLHVGVAWCLASGYLQLGALALALAAAFDGLDGTLARITARTSTFGAFLDSTLDRISEILVFAGLLAFALRPANTDVTLAALCYAIIAGSLMVSYTRAKSEALRSGTKAGVFGRLERMCVLVVGLWFGWLTATLWILAVGVWWTTLHRIWDVRRRLGEVGAP